MIDKIVVILLIDIFNESTFFYLGSQWTQSQPFSAVGEQVPKQQGKNHHHRKLTNEPKHVEGKLDH